MGLLMTILLFVVIMAVVALVGLKFYVRPKEAMERVAGVAVANASIRPGASEPGVPPAAAATRRRAACESEGRNHHAAAADSRRLPRTECAEEFCTARSSRSVVILPVLADGATSPHRTWIADNKDHGRAGCGDGWVLRPE